MKNLSNHLFSILKSCLSQVTRGPQSLLFLAAAALAARWLGTAAVILIIPLILLIFVPFSPRNRQPVTLARTADIRQRDMQTEIDRTLIATRKSGTGLACIMIAVHDPADIRDPVKYPAPDLLGTVSLDRLASVLRPQDQLFNLMNGQVGVVVAPLSQPGIASVLRVVERLRITLQAPVQLGSETIRPSVSIGVCLDSDAPNRSGRALCDAAMMALTQAGRMGVSRLQIYASQPQAGPVLSQRISARNVTATAPGLDDVRSHPVSTGINPEESRAPPRSSGQD